MVIHRGQRSRRENVIPANNGEELALQDFTQDYQALMRKHFESNFQPLPVPSHSTDSAHCVQEDGDSYAGESEWSGVSSADDAESLQVVDHTATGDTMDELALERERRTFMSSKPPGSVSNQVQSSQSKKPASKSVSSKEDDKDETDNLQKDLALQRLLKESHLLDSSETNSLSNHVGPARHRATDLRLKDLGGAKSIFTQEKMPMAQRKGMVAKASEREDHRRREARANGIILEREAKKRDKEKGTKRLRSIGGPSVGRFKGGILTLSKGDVAAIRGPNRSNGKTRR